MASTSLLEHRNLAYAALWRYGNADMAARGESLTECVSTNATRQQSFAAYPRVATNS